MQSYAVIPPKAPAKRPGSLAELVDRAPDLPAMPEVALATHKETRRPEATASSVAALVARDPALAVRVLRLANSAYYGVARKVAAVPDAVVVLGMRGVRNLCLLAGTYPWLQRGLPAYGYGPGALWSHSLAVAIASQNVAKRIGADGETAFTAGLLHDLGKVALSTWFGPGVNVRTIDDERAVIGYDHGQVGGELTRRWNLPTDLVEAITFHHTPCKELSHVLHLGDALAFLMEGGELPVIDPETLEACKISLEELVPLADELRVEHERQKQITEACA